MGMKMPLGFKCLQSYHTAVNINKNIYISCIYMLFSNLSPHICCIILFALCYLAVLHKRMFSIHKCSRKKKEKVTSPILDPDVFGGSSLTN